MTGIKEKVSAFLGHYGFSLHGLSADAVADALVYDMKQGLDHAAASGGFADGMQAMIPMWCVPPAAVPADKTVIVIDAGGTNFRSCLVSFGHDGAPVISEFEKKSMPGSESDRTYSKLEFYDAMAERLDHLKNKADTIGFCFSYAMEILRNGDGRIAELSKEINAPEIVGTCVGECLADALVRRGWNRPRRIVLLNDTAAALMAGAVYAGTGRRYSSYAGFILGTGMNSAYIESEPVGKLAGTAGKLPARQIVVTEAGAFDRLPLSVFDRTLDERSRHRGRFIMEKMCSGAYLGALADIMLQHAIADGLFSEQCARRLAAAGPLQLYDLDRFLYTPYDVSAKLAGALKDAPVEDYDTLYLLLDALIERAARLAAALIAAAVIKSGQGTHPVQPVCVVCNGTTFYKTHALKDRVQTQLADILTARRGIYFELVSVENDITIGSAAAALSL